MTWETYEKDCIGLLLYLLRTMIYSVVFVFCFRMLAYFIYDTLQYYKITMSNGYTFILLFCAMVLSYLLVRMQ